MDAKLPPISNVSDTARWVAVYRAMETERKDAIFRDPYARRLAGQQGEAIVDAMKRGRSMAWAMIVRTSAFDDMIMERIKNGGADVILNLAAGLDTRAWRLPLPPALRWIDVDLPEILDYKTTMLAGERPRCAYETVHADLTDADARRALCARVGAAGQRVLVVTEGLLIYLTEEQVGALATDLHVVPTFRWWLIDLASPRLLAIMQKYWGRALEKGQAPFRFAPPNGTSFFNPFGWEEAEFRSSSDEAKRLNRNMPMMWLWRLLSRLGSAERHEEFRRMSGFVMLHRR